MPLRGSGQKTKCGHSHSLFSHTTKSCPLSNPRTATQGLSPGVDVRVSAITYSDTLNASTLISVVDEPVCISGLHVLAVTDVEVG